MPQAGDGSDAVCLFVGRRAAFAEECGKIQQAQSDPDKHDDQGPDIDAEKDRMHGRAPWRAGSGDEKVRLTFSSPCERYAVRQYLRP
jgi:hypothetical protein